jgi:hypothetical protein
VISAYAGQIVRGYSVFSWEQAVVLGMNEGPIKQRLGHRGIRRQVYRDDDCFDGAAAAGLIRDSRQMNQVACTRWPELWDGWKMPRV